MVGGVTYNYNLDMQQAAADFKTAHATDCYNTVQYDDSLFADSGVNTQYVSQAGNTCTDGNDDGHIGFWEGAKSVAKGVGKFFTNIGKQFVEHPIKSILVTAVGIGLCCIPVVGPAIGVAMAAAGVVAGGYQVAKGISTAANATSDAEKKDALENIGTGATTAVVSAVALKGSAKTLGKQLGSGEGASTTVGALREAKANGATKGEMFKTAVREGAAETAGNAKNMVQTAVDKFDETKQGIKDDGIIGHAKNKAGEKWNSVKESKLYKKTKDTANKAVEKTGDMIDEHQAKVNARKAKKAANKGSSTEASAKPKVSAEQQATTNMQEQFGLDKADDIQVTMNNNNNSVQSAKVTIKGETYTVEIKHGKPTGTITREVNGTTQTFKYKNGKLVSKSSAPTAVDGKVPDGPAKETQYRADGTIKKQRTSNVETQGNTTTKTTSETTDNIVLGTKEVETSAHYKTVDGKQVKVSSEKSTQYTGKNGKYSGKQTTTNYENGKLSNRTVEGANQNTNSGYFETKTYGKDGTTTGEYIIRGQEYKTSNPFIKAVAKMDSGRFGTFTEMKTPGINDNFFYYGNAVRQLNEEF